MLSAVQTSMPASSSSWTSCQRLGWRLSGALVWASSSTTISFGLPLERRVDVELADGVAAVVDHAARQDLESLEESARLGAPVRFDEADDDVDALVLQPTRALQHRVGLTDAGGRADEHFQTANRIPPRCGQQRVRIGASVVGSGRLRHQLSSLATTLLADPAPSSAAKRWRGSLATAFTDVVTEDAGP